MEFLTRAESLAKTVFGKSELRAHQKDVIVAAGRGEDVLAIIPTGGGKSLCYQLPALLKPNLTVVISPLISLMKDQVTQLARVGVSAAAVHSQLTSRQKETLRTDLSHHQLKLLYVAPETFAAHSWQELLKTLPIDYIAVDEAHCVSTWGHEFRPSYQQIAPLINSWPHRPPILALTATATPRVQADIIELLNLRETRLLLSGIFRNNLFFDLKIYSKPTERLLDLLTAVLAARDTPGIIYVQTRRTAIELGSWLQNWLAVGIYHGGMGAAERTKMQEEFVSGQTNWLIATTAFGMGIDKPNVRLVIHAETPGSLEQYYQEAGRAGRDGQPAHCLLLHHPDDMLVHHQFIKNSARPQTLTNQLNVMLAYLHHPACQTEYVHHYFGVPWTGKCTHCPNCTSINESGLDQNHQPYSYNSPKISVLPHITQKWLTRLHPTVDQLPLIPGLGKGWLEKLALS